MEYNISFLIAALIFLLLQLYHFMLQRRLEDVNSRVFQFFLLVGIEDISLDIICTLLIQAERPDFAPLVRILITIFYLMQVSIPYAFMCYVISLREGTIARMRQIMMQWITPAAIMAILVVSNLWHGLLFTIDDECNYIHGIGYMWMFYYVFVYVVFAAINSIIHYKEIGWKKIGVIWEFLLVTSICVSIQALNSELLMLLLE